MAGCEPQLRIGWVGSTAGNQMQYRYRTFSGTERTRVQLETGQELMLTYDVTVEGGTLTRSVTDPEDQTLREERFQEDAQGNFSLSPNTSGHHRIVVEGEGASGRFDISWIVTG